MCKIIKRYIPNSYEAKHIKSFKEYVKKCEEKLKEKQYLIN